MFRNASRSHPHKISFLLIPNFSLFGLTAMLDPLRHANRSSGETLYSWELISQHGGLVESSDSIQVMTDVNIRDAAHCETLIICSATNPQEYISAPLLGFIRQQASHGSYIGCQDTAVYIAASAGIMDGYRCTMHWENIASTAELFPRIKLVQELLVIDRKRFSCPGALSGLDMMLYLIENQHGHELASKVADELIYTHKRSHTDSQRLSLQKRLNTRNYNLLDAVNLMQLNIEEPLRIAEISKHLNISNRELERLFRHYLNSSPNRYYRNIRLDHAHIMLQQTSESITSISIACGFNSLSYFTRCYQNRFGKKPSLER
jgi:transcriptional regulator GlxA family with amidase domain